MLMCLNSSASVANSVDLDQMLHAAASDLCLHCTKNDQKVLILFTLGMTKSRNCAIISQYNLPLPQCTFSNPDPVCLSPQTSNRSILSPPLSTHQQHL